MDQSSITKRDDSCGRNSTWVRIPLCLLLLVPTLIGCGDAGVPKLVPVSGVVKINGEPAAGIMVNFVPETLDENAVTRSSMAISGEGGKFVLNTTKNEPGAMPGPHFVTLIDTLEERVPQGESPTRPPRLDPKFNSTGEIRVTVEEGKSIDIEATGPKR